MLRIRLTNSGGPGGGMAAMDDDPVEAATRALSDPGDQDERALRELEQALLDFPLRGISGVKKMYVTENSQCLSLPSPPPPLPSSQVRDGEQGPRVDARGRH